MKQAATYHIEKTVGTRTEFTLQPYPFELFDPNQNEWRDREDLQAEYDDLRKLEKDKTLAEKLAIITSPRVRELGEALRHHEKGMSCKVLLDHTPTPLNLKFRGRSESLDNAVKRAGVKYPLHVVWVDGADKIAGEIVFPRADYKRVYLLQGDPDNPNVVDIPLLDRSTPSRPYYEIINGQTHVFVSGFSGAGTELDPFKVATYEDLKKVGKGADGWDLDIYYEQVANIQCPTDPPEAFLTIMDMFDGEYDGGNFMIDGLYFSGTSNPCSQGFFWNNDGCIKRVRIVNSIAMGWDTYSLLVFVNYGSILRCSVSGQLPDCIFGGLLAGDNMGSIDQCFTEGEIGSDGGEEVLGGLLGGNYNGGTITNSYSTATVTGEWGIGGLIGLDEEASGSNCYAIGAVTGYDALGGLVGVNFADPDNYPNCYFNTETTGQTDAEGDGSPTGAEGRTTDEMTYPYDTSENETYEGWDFEEIWGHDEDGEINGGYPYLRAFTKSQPIVPPSKAQRNMSGNLFGYRGGIFGYR